MTTPLILKAYTSAGTLIGTVPPRAKGGFKYTLSPYGGCLGATLKIPYPEAVRVGFAYSEGMQIRAYIDSDATVAEYIGYVTDAGRSKDSSVHTYTLRGLWDKVDSVLIDVDLDLGSESTKTAPLAAGGTVAASTLDMAGKIVKYLLDNWIIPAAPGFTYDASDIVGTYQVREISIRTGATLKRVIADLALMQDSVAGNRHAYGVDHRAKFIFKPIPAATVLDTTTLGQDPIGSADEHIAPKPSNQVKVIGQTVRTKGVPARLTMRSAASIAAHGPSRIRPLKIMGIWRHADAWAAGNGYLNRHAEPGYTVDRLGKYIVTIPASIPKPWLGQFRYQCSQRGIVATNYASTFDVSFGSPLTYEFSLGFDSEGLTSADGYGPSVMEDLASSDPITDASTTDLLDGPDATGESYTGAGDDIDPPVDYPHLVGPEIPYDGLEGSLDPDASDPPIGGGDPGTGGSFPISIVEIFGPGSARTIDTLLRWGVLVNNGGDTANLETEANPNPVVLQLRFVSDDAGTNTATSYNLTRESTSGDNEFWRMADGAGYNPPGSGRIYYAFKLVPAEDAENPLFFPVDIVSGTSDLDKAPYIRVDDQAGSTLSSGLTLNIGVWAT